MQWRAPFFRGRGGLRRRTGPGAARNLGLTQSGAILAIRPRAAGVLAQIGGSRSSSCIRLAYMQLPQQRGASRRPSPVTPWLFGIGGWDRRSHEKDGGRSPPSRCRPLAGSSTQFGVRHSIPLWRLGVVDFTVARGHSDWAGRRQGWLTRTFWPLWFARDGVLLNPDHLPCLRSRFLTEPCQECRARVPFMPGVRVPYYLWIGSPRPTP
ncbi:MAG TPA: hypothetical protein VLI39_08955 [Sedimentisphaerales bacterium]|nr:hypothetical protein [Sedimentisphaerales bacterium]